MWYIYFNEIISQARSHSDLHDWSVVASRFRCFDDILYLIGPLYEEENGGDRYQQSEVHQTDKIAQHTKYVKFRVNNLVFAVGFHCISSINTTNL